MYHLVLSGLGMEANTSSFLFPPLVDLEAMRYLGKRVMNMNYEGLDLSDMVKGSDARYVTVMQSGKSLQTKGYNWFKYNAEFHKGTITTRFIKGLSEGEHLYWPSEKCPEEAGYYYINSYDLIFSVTDRNVEYTLHVTRGTPFKGFHPRISAIPLLTEIPTGT